jgi:ADP-ribose pyrophosphatase YjhB (NUDIX family)
MKPIRNSAKAVILHNGSVLAIRKKSGTREYFVLPGGGQEHDETLADAVRRECLEEVGADVEVMDLLCIREYIGKNHEFAQFDSDLHQVEFFFGCKIRNPEAVAEGATPDRRQVGVDWLPISGIESTSLYPQSLKTFLAGMNREGRRVYLGDVN